MRLRLASAPSVASLAVLLAASACIDPIKPENAIYLELEVNQVEFAAGDSLYVTARAVNTINESVRVERPCGRLFEYRILAPSGQTVFDSDARPGDCATDAPPVTLAGDGDMSETYATAGLIASDGSPLPAGKYLVDAIIRPAGQARRANGVIVTALP